MNDWRAIVLAAGRGTRMKSAHAKPLHELAGASILHHLLSTLKAAGPSGTILVASPENHEVLARAAPAATVVVQERPRGTADAVMAARDRLEGFAGDVLVLFADTPLVEPETIERMRRARHGASDPAVVVLGFEPADPAEYGRLILDPDGALEGIVEYGEADAGEREVGLCNSGLMLIDGRILPDLLDAIDDDNAKGEFYLTDVVGAARARRRTVAVVVADEDEVMGINSRADLAAAEAIVQRRLRARAMAAGATLEDPDSVHLCHDTRLGRDVVIEPNVYFGPGVEVGDDVRIRAFSHLEGCRIENGASIGPFARLRPETEIGEGARIGNFVEVKKAQIEAGAKVNHLSYIGDARVGAGANVGAGTITCNFDGYGKNFTDIGEGAFIGSNTALVAPVRVGAGAIIGAGSVVAKDVAENDLVLTRAKGTTIPDYATRRRGRKAEEARGKTGKRALGDKS